MPKWGAVRPLPCPSYPEFPPTSRRHHFYLIPHSGLPMAMWKARHTFHYPPNWTASFLYCAPGMQTIRRSKREATLQAKASTGRTSWDGAAAGTQVSPIISGSKLIIAERTQADRDPPG